MGDDMPVVGKSAESVKMEKLANEMRISGRGTRFRPRRELLGSLTLYASLRKLRTAFRTGESANTF